MTEVKLTEEQLENGAKAAYESARVFYHIMPTWDDALPSVRDTWRNYVLRASPYVQMRSEAETPTLKAENARMRENHQLREIRIAQLETEVSTLKAAQGFTVEQVRNAILAQGDTAGGRNEFSTGVIAHLTAKPTPEERYVVEQVHLDCSGDRWEVRDLITGLIVGEPDGFSTRATANTFRLGLIAQMKKMAK